MTGECTSPKTNIDNSLIVSPYLVNFSTRKIGRSGLRRMQTLFVPFTCYFNRCRLSLSPSPSLLT